jgi:hypothetical protein
MCNVTRVSCKSRVAQHQRTVDLDLVKPGVVAHLILLIDGHFCAHRLTRQTQHRRQIVSVTKPQNRRLVPLSARWSPPGSAEWSVAIAGWRFRLHPEQTIFKSVKLPAAPAIYGGGAT